MTDAGVAYFTISRRRSRSWRFLLHGVVTLHRSGKLRRLRAPEGKASTPVEENEGGCSVGARGDSGRFILASGKTAVRTHFRSVVQVVVQVVVDDNVVNFSPGRGSHYPRDQ